MRKLITMAACAALTLTIATNAIALPLTIDGGWVDDQVSVADSASDGSAWTFTALTPVYFSIVDCCVAGDTYTVDDLTLGPVLTTSLGLLPRHWSPDLSFGDGNWVDAALQRGQIVLAAGSYELTIKGDAAGGAPAGFSLRVDTVPEPTSLLLLGAGLAGMAGVRRRFTRS